MVSASETWVGIAILLLKSLPGLYFDVRTSALNSLVYTAAQALVCLLLSVLLDHEGLGDPRRHRLAAVASVAICTILCWVTLLIWSFRHAEAIGSQGWGSSGFDLACVSMILHGFNSSLVGTHRIVALFPCR
jgi:hypothetical protein